MTKPSMSAYRSIRRSAAQIIRDCVAQLREIVSRPGWFLSNGEDAVYGSVACVEIVTKGLRIVLDNGRSVVWKLSRAIASAVASCPLF